MNADIQSAAGIRQPIERVNLEKAAVRRFCRLLRRHKSIWTCPRYCLRAGSGSKPPCRRN